MIRTLTALAVCAGASLVGTTAFAQDAAPPPPPPSSAPTVQTSSSSSSGGSSADGAGDTAGLSVGAMVDYGFHDGVGFGIAARVGYTLPMVPVYVGGFFGYNFGSDDVSVMHFGVEGGYDIAAGPVTVRPYLGLGDAIASVSVPSVTVAGTTVGGGSASSSNFAVWPGATVLYPVTPNITVGGDAKFLIVSDFNTFFLGATGAYHF